MRLRFFRRKRPRRILGSQSLPVVGVRTQVSPVIKERRRRSFRRKVLTNILLGVVGVIFFFILIHLGVMAVSYVYSVRAREVPAWVSKYNQFVSSLLHIGGSNQQNGANLASYSFVKHLEEYQIPVYDGASFVFENVTWLPPKYKEEVEHFLENNSVYLLPPGKEAKDAFDFYKKELPKHRWQFVMEKPLTESYLVSGLYFVKENIGLRIYTLTGKDIWYEILPKEYAQSGLKNRQLIVEEQEFWVKISAGMQLPSSTGWDFKIPAGFRYETEPVGWTKWPHILIYDKQDNLFLEIMPFRNVQKVQTRQGALQSLKTMLSEYIKNAFGNNAQIEWLQPNRQGVLSDLLHIGAKVRFNGEVVALLYAVKKEDTVFLFRFIKPNHISYAYAKYLFGY